MSQRKKKVDKGWKKNWAGRGVEIMNEMEKFGTYSELYKSCDPSLYTQKVKALCRLYPANKFYGDLLSWISKGISLTEKQRQAIDRGYYSFKSRNS